MALFLISYDAHFERDYQDLYDALGEIDSMRVLESVWMLEADNTAIEIREWVRGLLDDDDSIFVIKLKPQHAWSSRKINKSITDWIREHNQPS